ncbi:hypothetical protein ACOSQ4_022671 [Xanthoceras sorbifolium]
MYIFGSAIHASHVIHVPWLENPLDGTVRMLHDTSGTFKHYIKELDRCRYIDFVRNDETKLTCEIYSYHQLEHVKFIVITNKFQLKIAKFPSFIMQPRI